MASIPLVPLVYFPLMEWEHKGIRFEVSVERLGPFFLASARAPRLGPYVRIRPFSALGRTEAQALELLREQIRFEYRRVPEPVVHEPGAGT